MTGYDAVTHNDDQRYYLVGWNDLGSTVCEFFEGSPFEFNQFCIDVKKAHFDMDAWLEGYCETL